MILIAKYLLVLSVINGSLGWWIRRKPSPPNRPPVITCPRVRDAVWADKGRTTTTVYWSMPTAIDPEGRPLSIRMKSPKASGSLFGRGSHTVVYEVKDSGGLADYCSFTFTVKVHMCRPMAWLRNGRISCDGNIYGKRCAFSCDTTYTMVGSSFADCQMGGNWSSKPPVCKIKDTQSA